MLIDSFLDCRQIHIDAVKAHDVVEPTVDTDEPLYP